MRENPNLDFMRAVAVLLVVLTHVRTYMHRQIVPLEMIWFLGMIGVFIFFTHTTLVLMWSLERDPHTLRFYVRRAFRLYPLWIVVLGLSLAVRLPTAPYYAPHFLFYMPGKRELLANVLLIMNLTDGARIIGASWSLPIEVQMYVVLPFLFFFMRWNKGLFALFLLDALAIATAHAIEPSITSDLLFCSPLFIPGAIAYQLYRRKPIPKLPGWLFPLWLGLLIAAVNWYASRRQNSFRSGWIFAFLLGCSLPFFRPIANSVLRRSAHEVAKYSYGLYLCHFAAIAVGLHYMSGYPAFLRIAAFLVVLVGLSVGLYHGVEQPMIRLGSKLAGYIGRGREPAIDRRELNLEAAP